jgi:hypothetical protein
LPHAVGLRKTKKITIFPDGANFDRHLKNYHATPLELFFKKRFLSGFLRCEGGFPENFSFAREPMTLFPSNLIVLFSRFLAGKLVTIFQNVPSIS